MVTILMLFGLAGRDEDFYLEDVQSSVVPRILDHFFYTKVTD